VHDRRLAGLVLGGGYGRGEGGVLRASEGDRPYNDLEFYVFTRGNRVLQEHALREPLAKLGHELSPETGVHVEFKVESVSHLRASRVSMFSYDLLSANRMILGKADLFAECEHHLDATKIPLSEAIRLLFNRCTGLLLARQLLCNPRMPPEDSDFAARNIAKAQLAVGDALLVMTHSYHWSCLERVRRMQELSPQRLQGLGLDPVTLKELQLDHEAGAHFKLYPNRSREACAILRARHTRISALAQKVWLAIENLRLGHEFSTHLDYAFAPMNKCSETNPLRNIVLNFNTFGLGGVLDQRRWRYPRERLLNSLPLLLWDAESEQQPQVISYLQGALHTPTHEWSQLVAAYKQIWPTYG